MDIDHLLLDILGYKKIEEFNAKHTEVRGFRAKRNYLYQLLQGTLFGSYQTRYVHFSYNYPQIPSIKTDEESSKDVVKNNVCTAHFGYRFHLSHGGSYRGYTAEEIQSSVRQLGVPVGEVTQTSQNLWCLEMKETDVYLHINGSLPATNSRIVIVHFSAPESLVDRINDSAREYETTRERMMSVAQS